MAIQAMKAMFWPVLPLFRMATADGGADSACDEKGKYSGGTLRPYQLRLSDHVGIFFSQLPRIAMAALCWHFTDFAGAAAGWSAGLAFPGGWVWRVVLRDLFLMVAVCGTWDWLLYYSPLKRNLSPHKYNKAYPSWAQLKRDITWTLSATLLGSGQELLLMYWWAGGRFKGALFGSPHDAEEAVVPHDTPFLGSSYTPGFVLWTVTMIYWRIAHFYFVHRGMHPWWDRKGGLRNGDIGAFLYRHVHSHHHKSNNPTAFSGISMKPVESILYISAALIPLMFRSGCHPWIHLYTKLDLIIGAQLGHDGHDAPGTGDYFHQLHHAHFECNYGSAIIPLDWLFGTFEDGSSYSRGGAASALSAGKKVG